MLFNSIALIFIILLNNISIVHARSRAPAWSCFLAIKITRRRFVTTFHGTYNFKNPFKKFYHQFITRQDPYSIEAVSDLLKKFKNQVHLIKGNSNQVLKKMDMSKIDFVFLDGGHEYNTVVNDLNSCVDVIKFNGSILCDDYNLGSAPGVKKAIDEFVKTNNFKCKIICEDRFALIEN